MLSDRYSLRDPRIRRRRKGHAACRPARRDSVDIGERIGLIAFSFNNDNRYCYYTGIPHLVNGFLKTFSDFFERNFRWAAAPKMLDSIYDFAILKLIKQECSDAFASGRGEIPHRR